MTASNKQVIKSVVSKIEQAREAIEVLMDEWQEKFDSASEKWQESEKGEALDSAISVLDTAKDELDSQVTELEELLNSLT